MILAAGERSSRVCVRIRLFLLFVAAPLLAAAPDSVGEAGTVAQYPRQSG